MDVTYPRKLAAGDEVRVIAPSGSRAMVAEHDHSEIIEARFDQLGLTLSYGAHVDERDARDSSSVISRVTDLHDAFADASVAGILTVIGGFNSNELLPHLDWELIRSNPKVFCGYSDITALQGAMLARAGLVTYSGPHWSSFGMEQHFEQTLTWFADALMHDAPVMVTPSHHWTDDMWFLDQDNRQVYPSPGWWNLQPGEAEGRLVGGNLCTLNLLQGTPYMPPIGESVLIIEDDAETSPNAFARDLTSLLQLPEAAHLRGLSSAGSSATAASTATCSNTSCRYNPFWMASLLSRTPTLGTHSRWRPSRSAAKSGWTRRPANPTSCSRSTSQDPKSFMPGRRRAATTPGPWS